MAPCRKSPTRTTATYSPSFSNSANPKRDVDEDESEHAVRGEPHGEVDDLDDRLAQGVEHAHHRLGLLFGEHRERGAEYQGKEDDPQHVERGRGPDRVAGHDVHKHVDAELASSARL